MAEGPQTMFTVFRKRNAALAERAVEIIRAEYPMTLRRLFYRVVSAGALENTVAGYNRLKTIMGRLREADDIPRTWIVDHIRTTLKPSSWSGLADFGDTVRDCYRKDFWASLPDHVEILVEKDAVTGTLQPITDAYDVALRVCRGYSSISFAGEIADQWGGINKPIHAYYLGDFDPNGFDLERDAREKLERYGAGEFRWHRLGVVPDDFADFNLIPLKPKETDTRYAGFVARHGSKCAELDAIPPTELRQRVKQAIIDHIDADQWDRLQRVEDAERRIMDEYVSAWAGTKVNLDSVSTD